jgi:hypothetical protein
MKKPTQSEYEKLSKELGRVDKERRAILEKIKKTPEYVLKHLQNLLIGFVTANQWLSNTNAKGEQAYYKLVGFNIPKQAENGTVTKHGSNLIIVNLEWDHYPYGLALKEKKTERLEISVFNDIDKQIMNGRKPTTVDEKKMLKAELTTQKEKLKAEIKALDLKLKTI